MSPFFIEDLLSVLATRHAAHHPPLRKINRNSTTAQFLFVFSIVICYMVQPLQRCFLQRHSTHARYI